MTKIAIPVKDNLLCRSFNSCTYFLIYEIRDKKIVSKKINLYPDEFRANIDQWSGDSGITDVIAHYIDNKTLTILTSTKIDLFVGVNITTPDVLVDEFLNGKLKSNTRKLVEAQAVV